MDTIIIKPKSSHEYKEILSVLKKLKVKTEIYRASSKDEILNSIEKGAKSAAAFIKGKASLQEAKNLLSEL